MRTFVILGSVLVVLAVGIYVLVNRSAKDHSMQDTFSVFTEDVLKSTTRIELSDQSGAPAVLSFVQRDMVWYVQEGVAADAAQVSLKLDVLNTLIANIKDAQILEHKMVEGAALQEFGFATDANQPQLQLSFNSDSAALVTLAIGKSDANENWTYVRLNNENSVYKLATTIAPSVKAADWIAADAANGAAATEPAATTEATATETTAPATAN